MPFRLLSGSVLVIPHYMSADVYRGRMALISYWLEPGLILELKPEAERYLHCSMSATQSFQAFDATRSQPLNREA